MSSAAEIGRYWADLELVSVAELVKLCGEREAHITLVPILSMTSDVMVRCLILQQIIRDVRAHQAVAN